MVHREKKFTLVVTSFVINFASSLDTFVISTLFQFLLDINTICELGSLEIETH